MSFLTCLIRQHSRAAGIRSPLATFYLHGSCLLPGHGPVARSSMAANLDSNTAPRGYRSYLDGRMLLSRRLLPKAMVPVC